MTPAHLEPHGRQSACDRHRDRRSPNNKTAPLELSFSTAQDNECRRIFVQGKTMMSFLSVELFLSCPYGCKSTPLAIKRDTRAPYRNINPFFRQNLMSFSERYPKMPAKRPDLQNNRDTVCRTRSPKPTSGSQPGRIRRRTRCNPCLNTLP